MPLLLRLGMIGSALLGGIVCLFLLLAPFDVGSYTINDEPVSGPEFLTQYGLGLGAAGLLSLANGYALWREQRWSRHGLLLFWIPLYAGLLWDVKQHPNTENLIGIGVLAIVQYCITVWYLYGKASVRTYYASLKNKR